MALFQDPSSRWCLNAPMTYSVLLLVYVILQFIAFFFVLVATPIEMFRVGGPPGNTVCITLWGRKVSCTSLGYSYFVETIWRDCINRRNRFRAAQGCAFISILVYGGAFVASFAILYGYSFIRWVCLALNVVGIVSVCIVWAAMAVSYKKKDGLCSAIKDDGTYGAGFVLFVIAWILDIINTVILLLPCTVTESDEDKHTKQPAAEE
ncbi:putative amastin-like surface protein [Leishmania mexicana MHOM/GT/2001/U1103]|uniref:Amastin-like surface protein n=1 Tax=Leishmania mexicana (strain MHOM/GT/2001/U1103) TaxID=929439 RepID=E9B4Y3_LEIMU|nr:putative amastin-like surface protein [Leishmania mexicana MHOM/GT/2001/U1103]CBZ30302.1 putative amastin-like surface protein [Leishmania mexicana MHOM/GT/2001/U1103]